MLENMEFREEMTSPESLPHPPRSSARHWYWPTVVIVLLAPVALAGSAVIQASVTVDEYQALPHGLALLKTGDFRLATTTQPLSQYLPATPLLFSNAKLDRSRIAEAPSTWALGLQFMQENRDAYHRYFLLGRAVSVLVLFATCLLAYGFSRSLYGAVGGLMTAGVAGLSPSLLAHGPLVTPDIYLAAGVVGTLWAFDYLLRRPGWWSGVLLGLALGAACLAKLTGALLFVLLPTILIALHASHRWRKASASSVVVAKAEAQILSDVYRPWSTWAAMGLALLVGLLVIHLGFCCEGSFTRLDHYTLDAPLLQKVQEFLPGWLPVPLPYAFFKGADFQLTDTGYVPYLLGKFNPSGFYHYYLVGLLVKTPVPVLLLGLLAMFCGPGIRRRELGLVVCGTILLCLFSLARHKNIGLRYVLFLEPLMAVWIGRLAASPAWTSVRWRPYVVGAAVVGSLCLVVSAAAAWPHYLAYFNFVSGGPARRPPVLLDSNLDWGQDLITLRRYMDREGILEVDLAYFGRVDPGIYGVRFRHLGFQPVGRYVAISSNTLWGRSYFINGTGIKPPPDAYKEFRNLKPVAVLGYTIYVYDMARPELLSR
jgi:hypothetical protein